MNGSSIIRFTFHLENTQSTVIGHEWVLVLFGGTQLSAFWMFEEKCFGTTKPGIWNHYTISGTDSTGDTTAPTFRALDCAPEFYARKCKDNDTRKNTASCTAQHGKHNGIGNSKHLLGRYTRTTPPTTKAATTTTTTTTTTT